VRKRSQTLDIPFALGQGEAAKAPSKSSLGLYPETLSVRYRYESDGSIVVAIRAISTI
jgi:hypothetical protein